jgi:hypothetical protein
MRIQRVLLTLIALLSITAFSCASTHPTDATPVADDTVVTVPDTMTSSAQPAADLSHMDPNYSADRQTGSAADTTNGVIHGTADNNVYTVTGPGVTSSTGTDRANLDSSIGSMTSSSSLSPDSTADTDDETAGTRRRLSKD